VPSASKKSQSFKMKTKQIFLTTNGSKKSQSGNPVWLTFAECSTIEVSFQHHVRRNKQQLWCNKCASWKSFLVCFDNEIHTTIYCTIYTTLSSLRNWANNDRYRLQPSTPTQLCWSSSRLQPLQNYNLIKFALIRPSTLNHDRNLWTFEGAQRDNLFCRIFLGVPTP